MEITHLGYSSFKIRGKIATVVTDPYKAEKVGMKFPKVEADIVTVSHQHPDHNNIAAVLGSPVVITGPGEYEIAGSKIIGIESYHDNSRGTQRGKNTIYHIDIDGVTLVHLGDLGHKLEDSTREMLNGVDILMIPVGGVYTITPEQASQVVTQLEPNIIIPMHYKNDKVNQENLSKLSPVDAFLKEMGKDSIVPQLKLTISRDKIPVEQTIVVLE